MLYPDRPTIGILCEIIPVGYYFPVFKGIYDTCHRLELNLRIFQGSHLDTTFSYFKNRNIIYQYARDLTVDGIITTSASMSRFVTRERFLEFLSAINVPKISLGMEIEGISSIIVNNRESIYSVVDHLIHVHKLERIAYIGGLEDNVEAAMRFKGYKEALADHNIRFDPGLYVEGSFIIESGIEGAKILIDQRGLSPQAIVCANDEMAIGVYRFCQERGIRIPEDLAVTGFDNITTAHNLTPQLTTAAPPLYGQGAAAVEHMLQLLAGTSSPKTIMLPTTLLQRCSCGCPALDRIVKDPWKRKVNIRETQKSQLETFLQKQNNALEKSPVAAFPDKLLSILHKTTTLICSAENEDSEVNTIKEILRNNNITDFEVSTWIDVILLFYSDVLKLVSGKELKQRIDYVFFIVHNLMQLSLRTKLGNIHSRTQINTQIYNRTLNSMSSCISLRDLYEVLETELITHGDRYFYLFFYESKYTGCRADELAGKNLRLFIGYDGTKVIDGRETEIVFKPEELVPRCLFPPDRPHCFLAQPLIMNEYYFGTFIIDFQEKKISTYLSLYNQLCATLNMIRLFENSRQKQQELNEINRTLEHKVNERTSELTQANEKLRELDRVKTTFFANISHELRTPLTLLLGPLESFHDGGHDSVMRGDEPAVCSMVSNGSRLLKLINNLLDFSKLDAGKMEPRKKLSSVSKIIAYYMSVIRSSAEAKGILTELENRDGDIYAFIDRDLFEKAFFNLISNALKFTPGGGTIRVVLEKGPASSGEKTFTLAVHDTGCGIKTDKIDTIFERFSSLDETEDRSYEGTGIGLAYTKEIMQLHGGFITAQSTYGRGSVFTLTLPLEENIPETELQKDTIENVTEYLLHDLRAYGTWEESQARNTGEITAGTLGAKKTICVVDDNRDMREYLKSILEKKYRVVTAENGKKGLVRIARLRPDMVISDVMMPVMNGLELCRAVKENPELNHIPVLLLTARLDISRKLEGLEVRADDYLFKPFNARELKVRCENLLANRELQIKLSQRQNHIMNSIRYAQRIQKALFPSSSVLEKQLGRHFILFKPKDIVGGDIYWFKDNGDTFLIALADCTGHGIPGALMTMITYSLLNRIADHMCSDNPACILGELNRLIKRALNQVEVNNNPNDSVSDDGLDIGLCYFDKQKGRGSFAGARRPLYYMEHGELKKIAGDRKSIGYRKNPPDSVYTAHDFLLRGKSCFFLTTDGYEDQLGPAGVFGAAGLKQKLFDISNKPADIQKKQLEDALDSHMEGNEQNDDISIIGFSL